MNADDVCNRDPQDQPKEVALAVLDQAFQSWAEVPAELLLETADGGPLLAPGEDRPLLVPSRPPRGTVPTLALGSDYVRELQAEFEQQEEGGKLR